MSEMERAFNQDAWDIIRGTRPERRSVSHKKYKFIKFHAWRNDGEESSSDEEEQPVWTFMARGWNVNSDHKIKIKGKFSKKMVSEAFFKSLETDEGKFAIFNYLFEARTWL